MGTSGQPAEVRVISAIFIPVHGACSLVSFQDVLPEYQKRVGGFIENVYLIGPEGGMDLLVDEEGSLKEKELNHTASWLTKHPIVGDALLLRCPPRASAWDSATEADLAWVKEREKARLDLVKSIYTRDR